MAYNLKGRNFLTLKDYTKEEMRKRDMEDRDEDKSHYRKQSTGWEEEFTDKHKQEFYEITGNLVDILGYERQ